MMKNSKQRKSKKLFPTKKKESLETKRTEGRQKTKQKQGTNFTPSAIHPPNTQVPNPDASSSRHEILLSLYVCMYVW